MAQRVGEGSHAGSPGIVAFAYAPPYGGFQPAQVVQRNLPKGPDRAIGAPGVLTSLVRDRGVVAWNGYVDGRLAGFGADVRSGRASTPHGRSLAGTDARLAGLATGPRGGVVLNWWSMAQPGTIPDLPAGVYARARAAGTTDWGPLEPVVTTGPSVYPGVAAPLAVHPVRGRVDHAVERRAGGGPRSRARPTPRCRRATAYALARTADGASAPYRRQSAHSPWSTISCSATAKATRSARRSTARSRSSSAKGCTSPQRSQSMW